MSTSPSDPPLWRRVCAVVAPALALLAAVVALALLSFVYWLPPVTLSADVKRAVEGVTPRHVNARAADLLKIEHDERTAEIARNMQSMWEWYRLKFLFIGTVIAAILFKLYYPGGIPRKPKPDGGGEQSSGGEGEPTLQRHPAYSTLLRDLNSNMGLLVLALCMFICHSIDSFIYARRKGSLQDGLWIRHVVEPAFYPYNEKPPSPGDANEKSLGSPVQIIGWERFLRDPPGRGDYEKAKKPKKAKRLRKADVGVREGLHFFWPTTLFHWVPLHTLTFLLYLIYLYVICRYARRWVRDEAEISSPLFWTVFVFIHGRIMLFALQIHILPNTLSYKNHWLSESRLPLFALASVALSAVAFLCFLVTAMMCRPDTATKKSQTAAPSGG